MLLLFKPITSLSKSLTLQFLAICNKDKDPVNKFWTWVIILTFIIYYPIRRWKSGKSFSLDIPLWIELSNTNLFFDYFKHEYESDNVMLIWDDANKPSNLNEIEEFCTEKKWICTEWGNVRGSEANVTILYDFNYEYLTRAKTQLVIVTIDGRQRYFLRFQSCFAY